MKSALARWLPAIATLALLLVALLAPVRRVGAGSGPVTDSVFSPSCDLLLEQSGSSATYAFGGSSGVTQPVHFTANVAACSLGFDHQYYSAGTVRVVRWNPATLTPDPTTVALRTVYCSASQMQNNTINMYFDPPLVLREASDLAEGFGTELALEFKNQYNPETAHYDPNGAADLPVARQFASDPSTPQAPLPGEHPVLDHRLCGGNSTLQGLEVVQSVVQCDSSLAGGALYEAAQRFRVSSSVELRWIEFVLQSWSPGGYWGAVAIYDADGQSAPPATWGTALAQGSYLPMEPLPAWQSHTDFDQIVVLQPEHDYWLVNRTLGEFGIGVRRRTGTESASFQDHVGPCYIRSTNVSPWTSLPRLALDFRAVGQPFVIVAVPTASSSLGPLRLAVAPSPSRGPVAVSWTGARGAVRFDVIDARGRRVASGEADAAATGRWTWNGASADGRALPAGVYFVHARDRAAHAAVERVVLVR